MSEPSSEWRDLNHAWWDERAPIHADSDFYRASNDGLEDFEWEEIGVVDGLDVIHPQCHIGTDAISLAARGARTVGLDFSANAIEGARRLAAQAGVSDGTVWVVGDAYDAAALTDRTFDLVYTGKGALCWLPDMDRWASVMWALCRPGGRLYVSEFHPFVEVLTETDLEFERSYFPRGGEVFDAPGSYADRDAMTVSNQIVDFVHPFAEVVQAVLDAGFVLRSMTEYPFTVYERWPWLIPCPDRQGIWVMPEDRPQLPLMYSLMLDRPA